MHKVRHMIGTTIDSKLCHCRATRLDRLNQLIWFDPNELNEAKRHASYVLTLCSYIEFVI